MSLNASGSCIAGGFRRSLHSEQAHVNSVDTCVDPFGRNIEFIMASDASAQGDDTEHEAQ